MAIQNARFVTRRFQQDLGAPVLQRQMRLAAAEIDAVAERPWRIDEREPHATASCRASLLTEDSINQSRRRFRPDATPTSACHPSAFAIASVFDTYQG